MDKKSAYSHLSLNPMVIHGTIEIFTGHYSFSKHAERLNVLIKDFCRSSWFKKVEENVFQLMCHCSAIAKFFSSRYSFLYRINCGIKMGLKSPYSSR